MAKLPAYLMAALPLAVGVVLLAAYTFISRRYFFSVPFGGLVLALVLYVLAAGGAAMRQRDDA